MIQILHLLVLGGSDLQIKWKKWCHTHAWYCNLDQNDHIVHSMAWNGSTYWLLGILMVLMEKTTRLHYNRCKISFLCAVQTGNCSIDGNSKWMKILVYSYEFGTHGTCRRSMCCYNIPQTSPLRNGTWHFLRVLPNCHSIIIIQFYFWRNPLIISLTHGWRSYVITREYLQDEASMNPWPGTRLRL
jgi:hypothetical protein